MTTTSHTARRQILIVEDSPSLAATMQASLEPLGHETFLAKTGREAYSLLRSHKIDCILLDLHLPDIDGLEILTSVQNAENPPGVIITTSNASLTTAVHAVRQGAFDYLVKPFQQSRLVATVETALLSVASSRVMQKAAKAAPSAGFANFIGQSPGMKAIYRTIEAAAPSTASVFITGESGTGKELVADAVHRFSRRSDAPFVPLNCAAIPRDLMESVIFGHVKGAFTGAVTDQEGAAARADGGTMFLDELGVMDPGLQTKLLRFIQSGVYERVGEGRVRKADIRFVAATNRDPIEAIRSGRLQEDLYYRLNVVPVDLPPLRDRGADIALIANHFLLGYAADEGKAFTGFAPEVEARFLAYGWPGNVRQLQNVVRNVVVLNEGQIVTLDMLPAMAPSTAPGSIEHAATPGPAVPAPSPVLPRRPEEIETLALAERRYIENAVALCGGNLQLAARRLGISPSTIYRKRDAWQAPG